MLRPSAEQPLSSSLKLQVYGVGHFGGVILMRPDLTAAAAPLHYSPLTTSLALPESLAFNLSPIVQPGWGSRAAVPPTSKTASEDPALLVHRRAHSGHWCRGVRVLAVETE